MLVTRSLLRFSGISLNGMVKNIQKRTSTDYAKAVALRPTKPKSQHSVSTPFSDSKSVQVVGGKGGDGCVSFMNLWCNENAGPDGGDGGNGGHVIFEACYDVRNFNHLKPKLCGIEGGCGHSKDRHGKSADHTIIKVPVGTIIRNKLGQIIADLNSNGVMFLAARGGAGGKGNHFFATSKERAPKICEFGPEGENITYKLELRSMADVGLIGLPNAGKSTLLNAISRAKSKIAPYAFTTKSPHIGVVNYDNHTQVAVADLPGLIPGAHKNKGLGIQFLKHAERCLVLMYIIDATSESPLDDYKNLRYELQKFNKDLVKRPHIIVANKIDEPGAEEACLELRKIIPSDIIPISAKFGTNLAGLLRIMLQYVEQAQT